MNRVKTRTLTALVLVAAMTAGFYYIAVYFTNGAEWASFKANRNIYTNGLVLTGTVVDRNDTV